MDSEQVERIKDERMVSRPGFSDRQSQQQERHSSSHHSGPSLFKLVGSILLVVLVAGIFMLLFSMDKKLRKLDNQNAFDDDGQKKYVEELKKLVFAYESRFDQFGRELDRLNEENNKLRTELKEVSTQLGVSQNNKTGLIPYIEKNFEDFKLTINFLHAHDRETYFYQKVDFIRSCLGARFLQQTQKARQAFLLAFNNINLPHFNSNIENQRRDRQWKDHQRLSKEYDFNLPQKPFCIVVATINNARNFRYQYNLQSMINLNYKNFKIVIIDDGSNDDTYELILKWIEDNNVTHNIVVIRNEKRLTAVPNIYTAVTQYCSAEDIVVLVDGDDQILGRHAFKVFNHVYTKNNVDIVYSSHILFYTQSKQVFRGWSKEYSEEEKKKNLYRDVPQKIAHLRSFKAKLFLKIKIEDLKDLNGEWYTSTYDEVICLPMLEMACGRVIYVDEFFYLYNYGLGTNDRQVDYNLQKRIADEVKYKRKKYECLPQLK